MLALEGDVSQPRLEGAAQVLRSEGGGGVVSHKLAVVELIEVALERDHRTWKAMGP